MEIPSHIAIIPDGNRRYATKRGISRQEGYAIGIRKIGDVLKWCKESDVRMLTMWGFSIDNFKRDPDEIKGLFQLFKENLGKGIDEADKGATKRDEIRVKFFGRIGLLPQEIQGMIRQAERTTSKGNRYQLNLLLSYGGREEIVDAVNEIISSGAKRVDEDEISRHLYMSGPAGPGPDNTDFGRAEALRPPSLAELLQRVLFLEEALARFLQEGFQCGAQGIRKKEKALREVISVWRPPACSTTASYPRRELSRANRSARILCG